MEAINIIQPLYDHWPVLFAIGFVVYWIVRAIRWGIASVRELRGWVEHIADERIPGAVKATLQNGGGDIIRRIIADENERQKEHIISNVQSMIASHEQAERENLDEVVGGVEGRIDRLEDRLRRFSGPSRGRGR